jgi:hypothetical protein
MAKFRLDLIAQASQPSLLILQRRIISEISQYFVKSSEILYLPYFQTVPLRPTIVRLRTSFYSVRAESFIFERNFSDKKSLQNNLFRKNLFWATKMDTFTIWNGNFNKIFLKNVRKFWNIFASKFFALLTKLAQTTLRGGSLSICHLLNKCRQHPGEYLIFIRSF